MVYAEEYYTEKDSGVMTHYMINPSDRKYRVLWTGLEPATLPRAGALTD